MYFMLSQPTRLFGNLIFYIKRKDGQVFFKSVNVKQSLVAVLLGRIFEVARADVVLLPL